MKIFWTVLSIWNFIVLLMYRTDKLRSVTKGRRTKESTLLLCSILMGAAGAIIGMMLFNHKTRKMKFCVIIPLAFILNVIIAAIIYYKY